MRKMNVILLTIGAVVVLGGAAGWVACGGWRAVAREYTDDATSAAEITRIEVSGGTVAVEVRANGTSGVHIHRTARYLNPVHAAPGATYRIEGSVLYLRADDAAFSAVEYVVTVPAGVAVHANVGTGSLDVAGVSAVDATVSTGSITVTEATGDVTANVGTGSITGKSLHSDSVVATAGTGGVALDLATPANVEARTGVGAVDVTVPSGAYRIDASSGMGDVKLGIPNDPNGAFRLSLRTNMGRVTLATH